MLRSLLISIPLSFFLSIQGCSFQGKKDAPLEVRSIPDATVFVNGEHVGKTPLRETSFAPGTYTLRLVTETQDWTGQIELFTGGTTMVSHTFGEEGRSATEIASFVAGKGVILTSTPDGALVTFDGELVGSTPISIPTADPGAHTLRMEKIGYAPRSIVTLNVEEGYATRVHVALPMEEGAIADTPPVGLSTDSAVLAEEHESLKQSVVIQPTGTGWLRVRKTPGGLELMRVNVGERYPLVSEEDDWVQIELDDGATGWVARQFVVVE